MFNEKCQPDIHLKLYTVNSLKEDASLVEDLPLIYTLFSQADNSYFKAFIQ